MIHLLTYADHIYYERQQKLITRAQEFGITPIQKNKMELLGSEIYEPYKFILSQPRGSGYWLWKPYFILQTLQELAPDDVLIYLDAGDWLKANPTEFLTEKMKTTDILLTQGAYKNSDWTKRDCFELMNADIDEYHNAIQIEAGIIVCKNTQLSIMAMSIWLECCKIPEIITDMPNICGKDNLPGFKDHRHDQSILTNIMIRLKLTCTDEMREFITCNYEPLLNNKPS